MPVLFDARRWFLNRTMRHLWALISYKEDKMVWFQRGLIAIALMTGTGAEAVPAVPAGPSGIQPKPDGVVANCDDYVKVTDQVFTGRTGATFSAGGVQDYLGGDTFGPKVLDIGGVDPAIYLQRHCGH